MPFVYTNNTMAETELVRPVPFTRVTKFYIHWDSITKIMKYLYNEHYTILRKKTEKAKINQKIFMFVNWKNYYHWTVQNNPKQFSYSM